LYTLVAKSLANIERYFLYTYVVEIVAVMVTAVVDVGYLGLYVIEFSNEGMLDPVYKHLRAKNHHKDRKQCLQMSYNTNIIHKTHAPVKQILCIAMHSPTIVIKVN